MFRTIITILKIHKESSIYLHFNPNTIHIWSQLGQIHPLVAKRMSYACLKLSWPAREQCCCSVKTWLPERKPPNSGIDMTALFIYLSLICDKKMYAAKVFVKGFIHNLCCNCVLTVTTYHRSLNEKQRSHLSDRSAGHYRPAFSDKHLWTWRNVFRFCHPFSLNCSSHRITH